MDGPFFFLSAGCAEGVDAWDLRSVAGEVTTDKFLPCLTEEERGVRWGIQVTMQCLYGVICM